jgi:hypothetical protein
MVRGWIKYPEVGQILGKRRFDVMPGSEDGFSG